MMVRASLCWSEHHYIWWSEHQLQNWNEMKQG